MKKFVAGNWKMNGSLDMIAEASDIAHYYHDLKNNHLETALCVPATLISSYAAAVDIPIGGQDCHAKQTGAFTGDISANMLKEAGAKYVIIGHSERREGYMETSEQVRQKAEAALQSGLTAIICVGESLETYKAGGSADYVTKQVEESLPETANPHNIIISYEPIWAIGSGLTPKMDEIAAIHQKIFDILTDIKGKDFAEKTRLLYGGSVKGANAAEIAAVPNVHGALVGGASLTLEAFAPILEAFSKA